MGPVHIFKRSFSLLSFFSATLVFSLEVDEQLTARFLEFSKSKRTVLINRGLEDGLLVGDHAKFFVTSGVVARGVLLKATAMRSTWSIYRVVDEMQLFPDKVVTLKICPPVKLTTDSTRALEDFEKKETR